MHSEKAAHDPNPVSREYHKKHPHLFRGEIWFEVYWPTTLLRCMDWRVIREQTVFAA